MFRFRLQRVLELRERKERDAATALASAKEQAERAQAEQERLKAARDEFATRTAGEVDANGSSVGVLRTLHYLLGRLDERVQSAAHEAATAAHQVAQKQDELRAAFRDRRTIDRLRERHEESWRAAEAAADRQQMDEIALQRFQPNTHGTSDASTTSDAKQTTTGSQQ